LKGSLNTQKYVSPFFLPFIRREKGWRRERVNLLIKEEPNPVRDSASETLAGSLW
jgi:hypothetical protein